MSPTLLAKSRVLIVGAYRAESAKPQLTAAAHTTQWQLGRLATDAIVAMVRDMLAVDPVPSLLRDTVVAHACGSPLFAAEYLRLAIANGQLVRSSAAGWTFRSQTSADAERTVLPRTIEEIIRLRLDTLSKSGKQVAEIASVLGRNFQTAELISACTNQRELRVARDSRADLCSGARSRSWSGAALCSRQALRDDLRASALAATP